MRFTHNDVNFNVTYESHQNWSHLLYKYFSGFLMTIVCDIKIRATCTETLDKKRFEACQITPISSHKNKFTVKEEKANISLMHSIQALCPKIKKPDSPPAWPQEAYCPQRIQSRRGYPNPGWGGMGTPILSRGYPNSVRGPLASTH